MDFFETECEFVLQQLGQVYTHERECKALKLNAEQRLHYHQEKSAPVMQALHTWLNNQLLFQQVEPNSGLGLAIQYLLRHWDALTRFLQVAGAPLDNSLCEQAIKMVIRHRKNSLFFKTVLGAEVGDCLMSVIHTAARYGVNVFHYLNSLQAYSSQVAAQPERWLPWHYENTLQELGHELQRAA
jgi:transposase